MKTIKCDECGRVIGYIISNNTDSKFLCITCGERKLKNKKENPGGLLMPSGFIRINNRNYSFTDFGKKPKSRLDRFYIGLIEENYQPIQGSFFDRNCLIYKMEGEFLVKIKLPNGKNEYYLIKNDEVIDYFIEK